ncbi:hypothetical protein [Streptomyces virginiae]|uniref:hypothetical protein n=1 Tax=Streptomyces virginiae TaxID=1961 RepID=UPI00131EB6AB|nr:hypothetical protein [Streptomyces virginiae]
MATALLVSATALIALPVASAQAAVPVARSVVAVGGDIGWDSGKPAPTSFQGG